ncbi:hypothetical protein VTO73DRAFT_14512 [Trametes versicolor]
MLWRPQPDLGLPPPTLLIPPQRGVATARRTPYRHPKTLETPYARSGLLSRPARGPREDSAPRAPDALILDSAMSRQQGHVYMALRDFSDTLRALRAIPASDSASSAPCTGLRLPASSGAPDAFALDTAIWKQRVHAQPTPGPLSSDIAPTDAPARDSATLRLHSCVGTDSTARNDAGVRVRTLSACEDAYEGCGQADSALTGSPSGSAQFPRNFATTRAAHGCACLRTDPDILSAPTTANAHHTHTHACKTVLHAPHDVALASRPLEATSLRYGSRTTYFIATTHYDRYKTIYNPYQS